MRILALRGRNLASLSDEFEIDFKAPPLAGTGLFAITGDTGAGKSTILDAMCVALYGKVPRADVETSERIVDAYGQDFSVKDARNVLRRGATDGYAEVDFVGHDGVGYRAGWAVRRARGRASGKVQDAERTLVRLDGGGAIASGKTQVEAAVEATTGLTFAQFRRTVLLAQGDFDAFLLASEADRADLLEKLTGTDIYSRISKSAYDETSRRERTIKDVEIAAGAMTGLSDDERGIVRADTDKTGNELKASEAQARDRRAAHLFASTALQRVAALTTAEIRAGEANASVTANAQLLADANALDALRPVATIHASLAEIESSVAGTGREHERLEARRAELEGAASDARERQAVFKEQHERALDEVARWQPEWTKATELDISIAAANEEEQKAKVEFDKAESALATFDASLVVHAQSALGFPLGSTTPAIIADKAVERISALETEADRLEVAQTDLRERLTKSDLTILHERDGKLREAASLLDAVREAADREADAKARLDSAANAVTRTAHSANTAAADHAAAEKRLDEANRGLADASHLGEMADTALSAQAERLRAALEPGQPCPVCGSTHHVYDHADDAALAVVRAARAKRDEAKAAVSEAQIAVAKSLGNAERERADAAHAQKSLADERENVDKAAQGRQKAVELLRAACKALEVAAAEVDAIGIALAARRKAVGSEIEAARDVSAAMEANRKRQVGIDEELKRIVGLSRLIEQRVPLAHRVRETKQNMEERQQTRSEREQERRGLLGGEVTQKHTERIQAAVKTTAGTAGAAAQKLAELDADVTRITRDIAASDAKLQALLKQKSKFAGDYERQLGASGIEASTAEALLGMPEADRTHLIETARRIRDEVKAAGDLVVTRRADLALHLSGAMLPDDEEVSRLAADVAKSEAQLETLRNTLAALRQKIATDDALRQKRQALADDLYEKKAEFQIWHEVNEAIGSSDGAKFRRFAQGVTLGHLVALANHQLESLNPRYRLRRSPAADLVLEIIDRDMGDEIRSPRSLSGGERFLVSLALALALAGLEGNRSFVDTLFIDEGFGTLDRETLDMAIDALETLQGQGRQVGVITHVASMIDRIAVQIRVEKRGGGRSAVTISGGFGGRGANE